MKKGMYIGVIVLLAAAFIISAVYLGSYILDSRNQAKRYDELAQMAQNTTPSTQDTAPTETELPTETEAPSEATQPTGETEPVILKQYEELYKTNPDMVGWIRIEGTEINYPVMQTSVDNKDYYLYRNFDKEENNHGTIYAREECDIFKPSDNITLYGHNMRDGSMFAALGNYYEKKTWENNPLITFDTLYEYHTYKIFAVFKTTAILNEGFAYHRFEDARNEQEFNDFVATCKKLSFYDTGITPSYGDKMICLSTCEYTQDNGRFVVAAVRIS